ncbi:MAG TPA: ATP-binding protein [Thermoanaerobaculia bacterium]|nr:ATP-binding protein [Thermoanaerobaculia bacterium]
MIRLIEALRYRSLLDVRQAIGPFHVLVGPNASGKSTFLDVVGFLGDLLTSDVSVAVRKRSPNFQNLLWMGDGKRFELAIELEIPRDRREKLDSIFARVRYEVSVGLDDREQLAILSETLWLKPTNGPAVQRPRTLFPELREPRKTIVVPERSKSPKGWKKVVSKTSEGNDYFSSETTRWNNPFRLGSHRLALANLPEDEERFPVATWTKRFLLDGIQLLVLNGEAMRRPAPPGMPLEFQPDGSNLPWAIEDLRRRDPDRFRRWIEHVRTSLPHIQMIDTVERPEDLHRYLRVSYDSGLAAPSWAVSDGTLRLLALTLIAYLGVENRVYLIEEPENGIHPQAVETIFQSLVSTYGSQILCATHSPVVLSLAEPDQLLCFSITERGDADVVQGSTHPALSEWKRSADLGTLFATGVLG